MKIEFISSFASFDGIELDSRIPLPRIGELVLLKTEEGYYQYEVMRIVHSYATMRIFLYVSPHSPTEIKSNDPI